MFLPQSVAALRRLLCWAPNPRHCSPLPAAGADSSEGGSGASATAAFTKNTALVLEHLRREFAPSTGSKRRHPSAGDLAAGVASLSLDGLLGAGEEAEAAGRSRRGRLEAARWFYESLVLRSTGFVTLTQVGGGGSTGSMRGTCAISDAAASGALHGVVASIGHCHSIQQMAVVCHPCRTSRMATSPLRPRRCWRAGAAHPAARRRRPHDLLLCSLTRPCLPD